MKSVGSVIVFCVVTSATAQAEGISALDTGAGLYNDNNGAVLVDPNWTVSLISTVPAGQIPPGGIPSGSAYLVPNNIGFPFGYWVPNSPASSWLTYSTPTQVDGDVTDDTFQYQTTFTAANSGVLDINFLSDNSGSLYINGDDLGSNPSQFTAWLGTPVTYAVIEGEHYTVDLDVNNTPQSYGNPTGARVEFSGNVDVAVPAVHGASVPEESSLLVNAALLALPFGGGMMRMARKHRAA